MPSITSGVQEYIQAMVDMIPGMKVLILDAETISIISMVFSQSDILKHEVFLVERIDSDSTHEKMNHLNAICLLRPTNDNFLRLAKELKDPKYHQYHLFFTNCIVHSSLERLACCDEYEVVHQVQEFFADVYALNHDLFSLNLPSTIRLTEDPLRWSSYEERVFERMLEGLLAACLTLRMLPAIRYSRKSALTERLAQKLQSRIQEQQSLFDKIEEERSKNEPAPVLLIVDRRNDPVTPLLNQWTYQAMLHELLTMENNRIDMSNAPDVSPELREIVMSTTQDDFFADNAHSQFGELCEGVTKYLEEYQKSTRSTADISSIEDMQKFVDQYPEFKRLSGNVSKHVAVVHELSRIVNSQGLMQASEIEQEIACSESRAEHLRQVTEIIQGSDITNMERLRLVLLYGLRYEHQSSIGQLKDLLLAKGIGEDQANLVDDLILHAGAHARDGDLFQNKSLIARAKSTVSRGLAGVDNYLSQHKSQIHSLGNSLMKGTLKESSYPFISGAGLTAPSKDQVNNAIIFMVGGATYEEARDVSEINKTLEGNRGIVLGGTTIHNSRSFLADIAQLNARGSGVE